MFTLRTKHFCTLSLATVASAESIAQLHNIHYSEVEGGKVKEGEMEMKEGWSWCPAAFSFSVFVVVPSDLHLFTGE